MCRSPSDECERGAILILALAYILIIGVVVAALTTWASGDLNNTSKFTNVRNLDYSLSSAVEVAINDIRYTPVVGSIDASPPVACWGSGTYGSTSTASYATYSTYELPTSSDNISTWCSTRSAPDTANTRIVSIYACAAPDTALIATAWSTVTEIATASSQCSAAPGLQAVVVFDDYSTTGKYVPGEGASLENWNYNSLAPSTSLPNSISITSTPQAINLVGGTYATAATATSGDTVKVTTNNASICSASGTTVTFVSNGTCIIYYNDPGNVNYLPALQESQTLTVGPLANTIKVTTGAPSNPQVGQSYSPTASATSGDTVLVTADASTSSVCSSASNIIYFDGAGSCQVDFNDPGNADYVAAAQQTQTMTVSVGAPAGLSIQADTNATTLIGYPANGDFLSYGYNEPMSASSILSGWGGNSTNVYVELTRSSKNASTIWSVCATSSCGTLVNLGTVNLGDTNSTGHYIQYGSSYTVVFDATMLMSTNDGLSTVNVTLGNVYSGSGISALGSPQTTLAWTPSASALGSLNSMACSTATVQEANAPVQNF